MKALMVLVWPLLVLNFILWWEHHRAYYLRFYPERPKRQAFRDMWRN